jgi:hypothetical protein
MVSEYSGRAYNEANYLSNSNMRSGLEVENVQIESEAG